MKSLNGIVDNAERRAINKYWLLFNPDTGKGEVLLELDGDDNPDSRITDLSPESFVAIATVLRTGQAILQYDGAIYAKV